MSFVLCASERGAACSYSANETFDFRCSRTQHGLPHAETKAGEPGQHDVKVKRKTSADAPDPVCRVSRGRHISGMSRLGKDVAEEIS